MKIEEEIKGKFKDEYHKAMVNIIYTNGWISNLNLQVLKPFGISMQQYNVLRILRGQYPNPAMLSLIQERMLDKSSNATRLVEKLRLKGLVERSLCENNRRKVDILITQEGLDLLKAADLKMEESHKVVEERITPEEAATLNELLNRIRD